MSMEQPSFEEAPAEEISKEERRRQIESKLEMEGSEEFIKAEEALFKRYTGFDAELRRNWESPKWAEIEKARSEGDYKKFFQYYDESLSEEPDSRSLLADEIRTKGEVAPEKAPENKHDVFTKPEPPSIAA